MATTLRIMTETRDRLLQVAAEDFGGVTADTAVARLLDEHWQQEAIASMERFRTEDPQGWAEYLADADTLDRASASVVDPWDAA